MLIEKEGLATQEAWETKRLDELEEEWMRLRRCNDLRECPICEGHGYIECYDEN